MSSCEILMKMITEVIEGINFEKARVKIKRQKEYKKLPERKEEVLPSLRQKINANLRFLYLRNLRGKLNYLRHLRAF